MPDKTGTERLEEISKELKRREVQDVKFTWDPDFRKLNVEELKHSVADFLDAYLDGRYKIMENVGDSPLHLPENIER